MTTSTVSIVGALATEQPVVIIQGTTQTAKRFTYTVIVIARLTSVSTAVAPLEELLAPGLQQVNISFKNKETLYTYIHIIYL